MGELNKNFMCLFLMPCVASTVVFQLFPLPLNYKLYNDPGALGKRTVDEKERMFKGIYGRVSVLLTPAVNAEYCPRKAAYQYAV